MSHYVFILLLTLSSFSALAQDGAGRGIAVLNEAFCGFAPRIYSYSEAGKIKQGLSVDFLSDEAQVNRPFTLRSFVSLKPDGVPADNLQLEHGKLMHLIGVRDDLSEFFHIHPARTSPGVWEVAHTFSQGGVYKIWADVKWRGISYSFGQQVFSVLGNVVPGSPAYEVSRCVTNSGFALTLKHSDPLKAGRTNQLEFSLRDQAGNPAATEYFLGSSMHLFIIKNDLSFYFHAHPDDSLGSPAAMRFRQILRTDPHSGYPIPGTTVTRFRQVFPDPGAYKFFAQFRPKNVNLPPDEAILAEFYVNVIE